MPNESVAPTDAENEPSARNAPFPELAVAVVCQRRLDAGSDVTLVGIAPVVALSGPGDATITIYCEFRSNGFTAAPVSMAR